MSRTVVNSRCQLKAGPNAKAFTLVEVLVVIAIIGILIALLIPSMSAAKANAYGIQTLANLRGIAQGALFYAADNKNQGPPGATNNEKSTGPTAVAYKCGAGRGIFGYAGEFVNNSYYGPKGLGILVRDYSVPLRSLFTENFEVPMASGVDDYALANTAFLTSPSSYAFTWPLSANASTASGGLTTGNNSVNTGGLVDRYQSQIECDYVYRAGDYCTIDTTNVYTTGSVGVNWNVSPTNLKTENSSYNKKTLIMSARCWYQGRPTIQYLRGLGWDCAFGDGSAQYYKAKDGNPSNINKETLYTMVDLGGATGNQGNLANQAAFVPSAYSGYTVLQNSWNAFAFADAYFAR